MNDQAKPTLLTQLEELLESLRLIAKQKLYVEISPGIENPEPDTDYDHYDPGARDGEIIAARETFDKLDDILRPHRSL